MIAAIETFVQDLYSRGVVVRPSGDRLAIDPVEKLEPADLEAIREREQEILRLFESGQFKSVECPGNDCREVLFAIDGLAYCGTHAMFVRFVEHLQ